MPKFLKLSLLAISVLLIAFVFLGGVLPGGVRASADDSAYQQIEVYSEVLQHIQNDYVVTPDIPQVTTGALHGLLEGLDPDSGYFTAAEYKQYQAHQKDGDAQIGVAISKRYGYATVIAVVPGSPADRAGIVDGDAIETIGGQGTRVMPLEMIEQALRGSAGSTVDFSVIELTSATPEKMTLTRTLVQMPGLKTDRYENSSILYLKPYAIDDAHVSETIAAASHGGREKILLDLRDTAGGSMEAGVRLANAFLKTGTIATLEGQKYAKQTWTADAKSFVSAVPLVVLVNHGTAGPAEIVAAALKDNNRAQLVGDRTFGSGSMQKQFSMPDGAMLFLSVAKYRAPDGSAIQDAAVTPNVVVAADDLSAAPPVNVPVTRPGAPGAKPATTVPAPQPDDQLNKALEVLKRT